MIYFNIIMAYQVKKKNKGVFYFDRCRSSTPISAMARLLRQNETGGYILLSE